MTLQNTGNTEIQYSENLQEQVYAMLQRQKSNWELAQKNYEALNLVQEKEFDFGTFTIKVQFNPSRIVSSAAKVDDQSIRERKCFLCPANLPLEQERFPFGGNYLILVNPFPIFRQHLTVPIEEHSPQCIMERLQDMLQLAKVLPGFTLFYNGPECGASAPDHMHFQAGTKGWMPLDREYDRIKEENGEVLIARKEFRLIGLSGILRNGFAMESSSVAELTLWFQRLYQLLENEPDREPPMNVLASFENGIWNLMIFPRHQHRPEQFYKQGDEQLLLSPASVDFGGVLITPREEDFHKMNKDLIRNIFLQVGMKKEEFEKIKRKLREMDRS